jgi:phage baseplate assembly protein W
MAVRNYYYRDINASTPKTKPDLFDVEAIVQNVVDFVFTRKGERLFLPDFGVDIPDLLFELMDDEAATTVFNNIVVGLRKYEPRVQLNNGQSGVFADFDNNAFLIDLFFEIEGFDGQTFRATDAITR